MTDIEVISKGEVGEEEKELQVSFTLKKSPPPNTPPKQPYLGKERRRRCLRLDERQTFSTQREGNIFTDSLCIVSNNKILNDIILGES